MKNTITFLCLLFSISAIKAQNRTTIAFLPISYDEASINSNEARIVQETIVNGFVSSKYVFKTPCNKLLHVGENCEWCIYFILIP